MSSSKTVGIFLLAVILTAGALYLFGFFGTSPISPPTPEYSQSCKFTVGVADRFNESSNDAMTGATLSIYDQSWNLLETISISSRTFTSAYYYDSGEIVLYKLACTGFQTVSGSFEFPFYSSPEQPISGYHSLNSIIVSRNPSTTCTYAINDAYNSSAATTYDVSTSGTQLTVSLEFYNTADETCNFNWEDATYDYQPVVIVENAYYNSTAAPLEVLVQGLQCIRAPTSTQSGLYIYVPSETSLDRDKNQATGILETNNRIIVSFTIDASQIDGSELGFFRFYLYENDDVAYHTMYGNALSSATVWEAPTTWNLVIKY